MVIKMDALYITVNLVMNGYSNQWDATAGYALAVARDIMTSGLAV